MTYDKWKTRSPDDEPGMQQEEAGAAGIGRESVDEALGHILSALDIIAGLVLKDETYDEVADEELRLGMIISRAQLILSFIDARRPPTMRAVQ